MFLTKSSDERYCQTLAQLLAFILLSVVLLCACATTYANEDPAWLVGKERLEQIPDYDEDKNGCLERWDILWSWAKKGSVEARGLLLSEIMFGSIALPTSLDLVSVNKNVITLAVHSTGYEDEYPWYPETIKELYSYIQLDKSNPEFYNCAIKNPSPTCVPLAIKNNIVPTFENYAAEIDFLLKHGKEIKCREPFGDIDFAPREKHE